MAQNGPKVQRSEAAEILSKRRLQPGWNESDNMHHMDSNDSSGSRKGKKKRNKGFVEVNQKMSQFELMRHKSRQKKISEQDDYFDKLRNTFPQLIEEHEEVIDRMQYNCLNDAKQKPAGDISSDDCVENATVFQFLLYKQRVRHMEAMWRKAFIKSKAAGQFIKFIRDIQDKIYLLGIAHNIKDHKDQIQIPCYIIPPDSRFSQVWSLVIAVLLIYTATYMPYKTCFVDESTFTDNVIDWNVDILFMLDILVNFLQATENSDASWIYQPKLIARNYMRSWFFFDLISVMPFQLIEYAFDEEDGGDVSSYNQLIRLARLPRLYRMTKLMRLVKILKAAKKIKLVQKCLKSIKVNSAITRMIQGMITALLLTHVFACFWFLTAKFYNFSDDTWVSRIGIRGSEPSVMYIWSLHWATQTITTVGYGDIPAFTNTEIVFSFIWMLIGVVFYSFIIGNFSSIITGSSQIQKSISYRVKGLSELARKAQIPYDTSKQIKQYIEQNVMSFITQDEDQQLIQTLPPCLRDEILLITYGELIDKIDFFKDVDDHDFMWKMLSSLKDIKFAKGDVLYWRGDDADVMYFVSSGKVKLYTEGSPFIKYQNGESFGDQDMLLNLPRDSKAVAITHLHLKALSSSDFETISNHAQQSCLKMIVQARKKRDKHFTLIKKLNERISRQNVIIQEMSPTNTNNADKSKAPFFKQNGSEKSLMINSSPNLHQSLRVSSDLGLSPQGPKKVGLKRQGSYQPGGAPRKIFTMRRMDTIKESQSNKTSSSKRSQSQQSKRSQLLSDSDKSKLPSEFANDQKTPTIQISARKQRAKSQWKANANKSKSFAGTSFANTLGAGAGIKKTLTRRHIFAEKRLKSLAMKNDNRQKDTSKLEPMNSGLMEKFWRESVPLTFPGGTNSEQKSAQKISQASESPTGKGNEMRVDQDDLIVAKNTDIFQDLSKSINKTKKVEASQQSERVANLQKQGFLDLKVNTQLPSAKNDSKSPKNGSAVGPQEASDKVGGNLLAIPNMLAQPLKKQSSFRRQNTRTQQYQNTVSNRVSLSNQKLNNALLISSRVKNAQRDRQLAMLSQRVKQQSQDSSGKHIKLFERANNNSYASSSQTFNSHDKQLNEKIEALAKLEMDAINEDENESENNSSDDNADKNRRTLLDKVVDGVFGKEKQKLYEMFPKIAAITVPKMPIITPKGDEIILRKKYNNNMNLLREAFESQMQLVDEQEVEKKPAVVKSERKTSEDHTPSQTPFSRHRTERSITFTEQVNRNNHESTKSSKMMSMHASSHESSSPIHRRRTKPQQIAQFSLAGPSVSDFNTELAQDDKELQKPQASDRVSKAASSLLLVAPADSRRSRLSKDSHFQLPSPSEGMLSKSFMQVNGRSKSADEMRQSFISPAVLGLIRQATKQIDQLDNLDTPNSSPRVSPSVQKPQVMRNQEEQKAELVSQLISLEDDDMSEVISSNASIIRRTLTSPPDSAENRSNENEMQRRVQLLQLLKEYIDQGDNSNRQSPQTQAVLGLFSKDKDSAIDNGLNQSNTSGKGRIEFIGNESMKSIVRFNMDSHLLGLNTFEAISMFDHVHQAMSGMKKKLKKVSYHIDNIEKRQAKLDVNADKMISKLQAYRALKKEVANLNRAKRLPSSKNPRKRKGQMTQSQFGTFSSANNSQLQKQDSQLLDTVLQTSTMANGDTNEATLPLISDLVMAEKAIENQPLQLQLAPPQSQQVTINTSSNVTKTRETMANAAGTNIEEMSAEQIAHLVSQTHPNNL